MSGASPPKISPNQVRYIDNYWCTNTVQPSARSLATQDRQELDVLLRPRHRFRTRGIFSGCCGASTAKAVVETSVTQGSDLYDA